jgi:hypothetical protein
LESVIAARGWADTKQLPAGCTFHGSIDMAE